MVFINIQQFSQISRLSWKFMCFPCTCVYHDMPWPSQLGRGSMKNRQFQPDPLVLVNSKSNRFLKHYFTKNITTHSPVLIKCCWCPTRQSSCLEVRQWTTEHRVTGSDDWLALFSLTNMQKGGQTQIISLSFCFQVRTTGAHVIWWMCFYMHAAALSSPNMHRSMSNTIYIDMFKYAYSFHAKFYWIFDSVCHLFWQAYIQRGRSVWQITWAPVVRTRRLICLELFCTLTCSLPISSVKSL